MEAHTPAPLGYTHLANSRDWVVVALLNAVTGVSVLIMLAMLLLQVESQDAVSSAIALHSALALRWAKVRPASVVFL
jgi:hypothetical protein